MNWGLNMRKFVFLFISGITGIFLYLFNQTEQLLPGELHSHYLTHFYNDTGAQNAVTAIYLNYRVFDTVFEALMLLVSVFGIIYFSRYKRGGL
jgi:multicomponent Na+:H+ antiporter subunit B